ncbi:hypothetical protein GN956_G7070 [Arapaima gigas]
MDISHGAGGNKTYSSRQHVHIAASSSSPPPSDGANALLPPAAQQSEVWDVRFELSRWHPGSGASRSVVRSTFRRGCLQFFRCKSVKTEL